MSLLGYSATGAGTGAGVGIAPSASTAGDSVGDLVSPGSGAVNERCANARSRSLRSTSLSRIACHRSLR